MLIAQISDTHILAPGSDHDGTELRIDNLRQCVADINRQLPDIVVFTGDTVQHGQPDEYRQLCDLLAPLKVPLFLVPGNRDDKERLRTAFAEKPYFSSDSAFLHYVVDIPGLRLIGIDSTLQGERKGVFCEQRQDWLRVVLADEPDCPTLLFIHHPPFDVGDHYIGGYRNPQDAVALAEIVSGRSQVAGLLCGHVHWPVEESWAGTSARIMPSVAVDVRKGIDEHEALKRPIYYLHRLENGRPLESELRRVD